MVTYMEKKKFGRSPFLLDRNTYKSIKAMDKEKMTECLARIYNSGVMEANKFTPTVEEIRTAISEVKGIGDARLNEIMKAVEDLFISKEGK